MKTLIALVVTGVATSLYLNKRSLRKWSEKTGIQFKNREELNKYFVSQLDEMSDKQIEKILAKEAAR